MLYTFKHKHWYINTQNPPSPFSPSLSISLQQTHTHTESRTTPFSPSVCHTLKRQLYTLPPFPPLLFSPSPLSSHYRTHLEWTTTKTSKRGEKQPKIEDKSTSKIVNREGKKYGRCCEDVQIVKVDDRAMQKGGTQGEGPNEQKQRRKMRREDGR